MSTAAVDTTYCINCFLQFINFRLFQSVAAIAPFVCGFIVDGGPVLLYHVLYYGMFKYVSETCEHKSTVNLSRFTVGQRMRYYISLKTHTQLEMNRRRTTILTPHTIEVFLCETMDNAISDEVILGEVQLCQHCCNCCMFLLDLAYYVRT